jgi:fatty acid desaturase
MSYDDDSRSMAATLAQMKRQALNKCSGNQIEADQQIERWIANDRRYDRYDPKRLASRVSECWSSGATLTPPVVWWGLRLASKSPPTLPLFHCCKAFTASFWRLLCHDCQHYAPRRYPHESN